MSYYDAEGNPEPGRVIDPSDERKRWLEREECERISRPKRSLSRRTIEMMIRDQRSEFEFHLGQAALFASEKDLKTLREAFPMIWLHFESRAMLFESL